MALNIREILASVRSLLGGTAAFMVGNSLLGVLRIVTALIFLAHGSQKLLGFPATDSMPDAFTMGWIAGVLELFGGGLLVIGLITHPVAFVLSGQMAAAYFIAHAPQSFYPALYGGDAATLYCFVFLYLVFAGPGPWSIDAMRGGRSGANSAGI